LQGLTSFTMRTRVGGLTSGGATGVAFQAAYISGIGGTAPLRLRNSGGPYDVGNRADPTVVTSTVDPRSDARWHDLVMVYKHTTNTAYLYIDGVVIGSGTLLGTPAASTYFTFGSRITGENGAAVSYRFSDCQLWSVPLTAEQIADMARSNVPPLAGLMFDAVMTGTPALWCPNAIENGILPVLGVTWDAVPVDPKSGLASGTTDGSGDLTVTHYLGDTPNFVSAAPQGTTFAQVQAHTIGATTFKLRFLDAAGNAMTASARSATWSASL